MRRGHRRHSKRASLPLAVAAVLSFAALATAGSATPGAFEADQASSPARAAGCKLALADRQRQTLRRGKLLLRAKGPGCASQTLRLRGVSRFVEGDADRRRITRAKLRSLSAGRLVHLPLTRGGAKRLRSCRGQKLTVRGRASLDKRVGDPEDERLRASARLLIDRPQCSRGGGGGNPGGPGGGSPSEPGDDAGSSQPGTGSDGSPPAPGADTPGGGNPEPEPEPDPDPEPNPDPDPDPADGIDLSAADRCDFIDPARCLFPWPNDHFTVTDDSTDSGRRLNLQSESMPANRAGVPINPVDYNRNDGFSPGQMIVTKVPGLETPAAFAQTDPVSIIDMGAYNDSDQPIVVINARTGARHPIWAELDANPQDPADVALLIRPSVNFEEGGRYVVALRGLRDAAGTPIPAQQGFRIYRDELPTDEPAIESRRAHFEELFSTLGEAGIQRESLYLAWDFTVASERNLSERVLSIRDDAFGELGDDDLSDLAVEGDAPTFAVTGMTDYAACGDDGCAEDPITGEPTEDDQIARKVEGTVVVPCYLDTPACPPGSKFAFDPDGLPTQNPVPHVAQFTCVIPRTAVDGADPPAARPSLYGHGLLGGGTEVEAGNVQAMAVEHNFVFCATDWAGFATQDIPSVLASLQDLSNFPRLVDRMQQGFLNFMYLGRLLVHPQGFASDPAFQVGTEPVIDTTRLFYDGNSQGGIMGGALTAVAPDFERAVLGVPGMNYSTLLRRSSDFAPYADGNFNDPPGDTELGLYDNYPDELERPLILSMVQMLWDRGEANGYAHHMTDDPLANTPPHEVLLHVAFGDHQVANVTAEVEARTIGASAYQPALDPGRIPGADPLWNIPAIAGLPFGGSALVYWDSGPPREGDEGVVNPPTTNTPPNSPEFGRDPHSDPRGDPDARAQKSAFLAEPGELIDVCGGQPCYAHGWTGPGP